MSEFHYYFSGSLSRSMIDALAKMPDFEPVDVLISQLERSGIRQNIEFKKEGLINQIFIDSGAYSMFTGKVKVDVDEYISFINEITDDIDVFAQLDTLPGTYGKPKSAEDYKESAEKSWQNYLYMRTKLKQPEKMTPVFHFGESFDALKRMLDYRDENGKPIPYVGISPLTDTPQVIKNIYLSEVYDFIKASSNPNVKTHLYGMTSIDTLSKVPAYSADSISHKLVAAYGKIWVPEFGVISISKRIASSMSFVGAADDQSLQKLKDYLVSLGTSLEECQDFQAMRVAVTMNTIMKLIKENKYHTDKVIRPKKLFNL